MAEGTADGPEAFGGRLRALRRRAGLSQQAAAERAGISTRALRDIEHGRVRRPRTDTLRRLAEVLELTGGELADLLTAARTEPARGAGRPRLLILGPLALQHGRTPVPVTGPMVRRLLGLLALKHPGPATRQEITDTLWPSGPPGSHQSLVHGYVGQVRRLLDPDGPRTAPPPAVVRTPTGYRLDAAPGDIDLGRFDELLDRARRQFREPGPAGTAEAAYESLTRALRYWRGPVLADADPVLRRHPAAVAADERRVRAALLHADAALRLRRAEQAVPLLSDLVAAEPLHEGLHARLILALASCGEQAAALAVFGRLRERLDEELGIAPGPEVHDAHLRVLRRQPPLAPAPTSSAPAPTPVPVPAQLPAAASLHVGRKRQLAELDALVAPGPARRPHLVTVVGPPGVGKTALVSHWAHARRRHFADGQLFADLRGHSRLPALRPGDVLAQFLRALGVRPDRLPADQDEAAALYRTLLAGRRMLIVLDDARDAEQVRPLIPGTPDCAVLITSRGRLAGLVAGDGARRLGLDVLRQDEARQLLGGTVGECRVAAEPEAAGELVRLCGGLPLAIRIAGANLVSRGTGIAEYCAELADGDVLGRLSVEGDQRSTVRAAFDLSYRALPAASRRMFRLLGLTPGPDLTADGAAALAGVTPAAASALLAGLADAHLVRERGAGRFGLHDLLRCYARDLAGATEAHAARRRLFDWYLHRTDAAARLLFPTAPTAPAAPAGGTGDAGPAALPPAPFADHGRAAQWLEHERENLAGAVLEASGTGFGALARRLAGNLHGYLSTGMHTGDCFEAAAARLRRPGPGRREDADDDLATLGLVCWKLGRLHEAAEHFTQVARYFHDLDAARAEAVSHTNLGVVHRALGRPGDAIRVLGDTLPLHLRDGNRFSETVALNGLSGAYTDLGDTVTGRLLAHTALDAARTLRNRALEANAYLALGAAQERAHQPADAADSYQEALRLAESVNDRFPQAAALVGLATVQARLDPRAALRTAEHAVEFSREARFRMLEGCALDALARVRVRLGESRTALESGRAALAVHRETGHRPGEARSHLALGHAQAALGARSRAFGHWRESRRLSRAMAVGRTAAPAVSPVLPVRPAERRTCDETAGRR
ncbi:BTAD domain-containing putative transcriptional regulator [Kitasatospora sp. NPDC057500]|uniref:BTAD domain-containing putative transcriptional regulator n=1 Tax=Kitasatospora sp. NPDC057500 TaxID=3346151 RepID=UPI00369FA95A